MLLRCRYCAAREPCLARRCWLEDRRGGRRPLWGWGACVGTMRGRLAGQYYDAAPHLDAAIEIFDILVEQSNAPGRHERADGRGLVGAVNAVQRLAKIERASAQRIARPARHEARQIGL